MKLYIGKPYWPDTISKCNRYEKLNSNIECQVLIIGAGMSGMLSAFNVSKNYKTVIIDENRVGLGSTSLNTGLIQYMSDELLTELMESKGEKIANHFYKTSVKALDNIEDMVKKMDLDCDFIRNNSIIIASEAKDLDKLKKEKELERKIGLNTDLLSKKELSDIYLKGFGALVTKDDIELNPLKLVTNIGKYCIQKNNLKIYENTKCIDIDPINHIVKTNGGNIKYEKLIIATGYNFLDIIKSNINKAKLIKTYAMITNPMEVGTVNKLNYMVWETRSPYFYYRKSKDNRLIIGGNDKEDLRLIDEELNKEVVDLKDKFFDLRGIKIDDTPYYYCAIFGESKDGLPYIGPHPLYKDIFIIHGVGGNGTVYSSIASMYVDDFLEEKDSLKEISYLFPE